MIRALLFGYLLKRARSTHPEMFDGAAALAAINATLAEYSLTLGAQH